MAAETRSCSILSVGSRDYGYFPVDAIEGYEDLPFALTVLLENVLRTAPSDEEAKAQAKRIVEAAKAGKAGSEIAFNPARVLFQDFTGVPVFVDFAAMREASEDLGGDSSKINPLVPCDLIIDHSVIADSAGCPSALEVNEALEFERNRERYSFLKWAQQSFDNVRIVPPGQGICHQLNIEKLASVVMTSNDGKGRTLAYFDTVVGTDSHTPTVNGLGVLGWGVGGIEAEAAALGQPITTLVPPVVGVYLTGALQEGVQAMDVALTFAEKLRSLGVVGSFVECYGPGVANLSATQRSCISNMTPEYGSTCTLFPIDNQTIDYLRLTGRTSEELELIEAYAKAQHLWESDHKRHYSSVVTLDLSSVVPSAAGPSRPHDRGDLDSLRQRFLAVSEERHLDVNKTVTVDLPTGPVELSDGAIAIAAVTSCTTATDPRMMLACGIMAKNAAAKGLKAKPWVKTILAPGSKATELLLDRAGLLEGLAATGFYTCGFGCMSCIGNSGPLDKAMHEVADSIELASVLSGNRNFDGRISPDVSQNYLMAPAWVVAYGLAGTVNFNFETQALGTDKEGHEVFLRDILPQDSEVEALYEQYVTEDLYATGSKDIFEGSKAWQELPASTGSLFAWDSESNYVRKAPYFQAMALETTPYESPTDARVLALLGDFITTDHISPAGAFDGEGPAGRYLTNRGVAVSDFNTYGSRRGNHEVMMRGTFGNKKLQNFLGDGRKGGWTTDFLTNTVVPIFDAAEHYGAEGIPAVIIAGKMYGSGSSRDWAAKGPLLLGVKAVIAESYERIHRSNLIGMGILPLQFLEGQNAETLGLDGSEVISIEPIDYAEGLPKPSVVTVEALKDDGTVVGFDALVRVDTPTEGDYLTHGGILQYVLRSLMKD